MADSRLNFLEMADTLGYRYEPRIWPKFGKVGQYEFYTDGSGKAMINQVINYEIKVGSFCHRALNDDLHGRMLSFAAGVCLFCLNNGAKLHFDRDMKGKDTHLMAVLRDNLHFPVEEKERIQEIRQKKFDFREFLELLRDDDGLFCDIDSAIFAYDLQGDEAIFHILCHVFTKLNRNIHFSCPLLHNCSIKKFPEISNFVSGTTFPVIVSPFSSELRWQESNNGWFLETKLGDDWFVLDCVGVGQHIVAQESIMARKQFWGAGGEVVPYLICWNWLDIVEAVGHFNGDVLVRDGRTSLFDGYWSKFGPNALINVNQKNGKIGIGKKFNTGIRVGWKTKEISNCTMNLDGKLVRKSGKTPIFSLDETLDWFELGKLCRTVRKK